MEAKKYPDYLQAVEDLLAVSPKPGELISHEWLDEHLGLDPRAPKYGLLKMSRVGQFRKYLLEKYQVDTKSVVGQGYYIVAPQDQVELALDDTIRGLRKAVETGLGRVINTKRAELTPEGCARQDEATSTLVASRQTICTSLRKTKNKRAPASIES